MILDKLIVTDDVSALADKSEKFANILIVSRKYGLTCVYFSHHISDKTKLANDNVSDKNIYFSLGLFTLPQ